MFYFSSKTRWLLPLIIWLHDYKCDKNLRKNNNFVTDIIDAIENHDQSELIQPASTCSKLTIETLEQDVKYV